MTSKEEVESNADTNLRLNELVNLISPFENTQMNLNILVNRFSFSRKTRHYCRL